MFKKISKIQASEGGFDMSNSSHESRKQILRFFISFGSPKSFKTPVQFYVMRCFYQEIHFHVGCRLYILINFILNENIIKETTFLEWYQRAYQTLATISAVILYCRLWLLVPLLIFQKQPVSSSNTNQHIQLVVSNPNILTIILVQVIIVSHYFGVVYYITIQPTIDF